jgi:predicted Zn-dependent peptidase
MLFPDSLDLLDQAGDLIEERTAINWLDWKLWSNGYQLGSIANGDSILTADRRHWASFFRRFFHPNNARLVVVGDFDLIQCKEYIDKYFAAIPNPISAPSTHQIIPAVGERQDTLSSFAQEAIVVAFRIPGFSSEDRELIEVIHKILSSGIESRLYINLVERQKIASRIFSAVNSGENVGLFYIGIQPSVGTTYASVENSLNSELFKIKQLLVSPKELNAAIRTIELEESLMSESYLDEAISLAENHASHKSAIAQIRQNRGEESTLASDIRRVAKIYLNWDERITLYCIPGKDETSQ